ncbi:MAG: hypothetical protein RL317_1562, partial [Pseudomonadota bacterium]
GTRPRHELNPHLCGARCTKQFASSLRLARQKGKTSIFMQRVLPNSTCREEQLIQGPLLNHFGTFGQAEQQPVIRQYPAIWA